MKRCSAALVIKETQNKTMMNLPTKRLRWRKVMIPVAGKDPEQQTLFYIMNGNLNWHNYFGKKFLTASAKAEYIYTHNPFLWVSNPFLCIYPMIYIYVFVSEDTYEDVLRGTIYNSQKLGRIQCPSTKEWVNCNIFR